MFTRYRAADWESQKEQLAHYRRRSPEESVLYRIVTHSRDELSWVWESRFQHQYGVLRDEVIKTMDAFTECGVLAHGAGILKCTTCPHSSLVAFSCKRRGVCPSCAAKRSVMFAEHLYNEILAPVPHRHIVFSLPKRLRLYFRYDRKLISLIFQAASSALEKVLGDADQELGFILTAQTAGEALNWNPHLHGLLAAGSWAGDEFRSWASALDLQKLTAAFTDKLLALLVKQELLTDDIVSQILSQEHSGFSVWLGEPFQDQDSAQFVARYIERGPVSLQKLTIEYDIVTYQTKDGVAHEFDALEFLAQLSAHIPKPYESLTRYYGRYSSRARGERLKAAHQQDTDSENLSNPDKTSSNSSWAILLKRIYEIDPLECPLCQSEMKITGIILQPMEIRAFMRSLGISEPRAPTPLPKPPTLEYPDPITDYD